MLATILLVSGAVGQCVPMDEFESRPVLLVPGSSDMVAADLNLDGIPDLGFVDGVSTGLIRIALGLGDGAYTLPSTITTGVRDLELVDFDGDGNVDIIAPSGSGVRVFWGDGTGTFGGSSLLVADPNGESIWNLSIADFDDDGDYDIAWHAGSATQHVVIARNDGDGTFMTGDVETEQEAVEFGFGDATGDGVPDLVGVEGSQLILYQITGASIVKQTFETGMTLRFPRLTDLDDDGLADVVAAGDLGATDGIVWLRAFGGGFFEPVEVLFDLGVMAWALDTGDVDDDGDTDVVVTDLENVQVLFVLNDGAAGLTDGGALATTIESPRAVELAELTNDGGLDLLVGGLENLEPFVNRCDAVVTGSCLQDLTGDGAVGLADLLQVLSAWGPCPE